VRGAGCSGVCSPGQGRREGRKHVQPCSAVQTLVEG
jgi:hypothetical protein